MKITPQRDWVLVTLEPEATQPENGGLLIVREARPTSTYAHVDAIGPEVRDVRVGARVVISRLQGISVGDGQLVLPESAVLAMEPLDWLSMTCENVLLPMTAECFSDELLEDDAMCGVTYVTPHEIATCILDRDHSGKHDTGDGGSLEQKPEPAPFLEQDDDTVFAEVDVQRAYDDAAGARGDSDAAAGDATWD